ncbi:MAG TPA: NADH/ubiquinone/plastoquinone (complex I), partial [Candidatus Omnitrophica bacterium]|nr:NADH/ubiquinone/plastoquinone (complex I) [Candidatus Omnitrophota bacterium]
MKMLPLFVALPIAAAFINYVVPEKKKIFSDAIANIVTFFLAGLSVYSVFLLIDAGRITYSIGKWKPPFGINLVLDGFSVLMLVIVNVAAFLAVIYSIGYMNKYTAKTKYYTVFLLMLAGINGVVLSGDIFNLYVFLEVASIASYVLVAFGTEQEEFEASFKYAILGIVGSSCIIIGITLAYSLTGTLNMAHFSQILSGGTKGDAVLFITALFLAGFFIKAAVMPFHAWLPDAHPAAPAPVSAMLSGVLIKGIGIYAMMRIFFNVIGITGAVSGVFMILGAISMVIGIGLALLQWDLKRMLAYSTISQVGYIMLGFGIAGVVLSKNGNPAVASMAALGALFHIVNHAVYKSLLFLNSGAIESATGHRDLRKMGFLGKKMRVTGVTSA